MVDEISRLEAELAGLRGAARAQPLIQLSQRLWFRYWQTGVGTQVGLPHLERAISALEEARGYFEAADPLRVQAGAMLGVSRCVRHSTHNGPAADRDAGIPLLEEALQGAGILQPATAGLVRVTLGEALMRRAMMVLSSPDSLMRTLQRGTPPAVMAELDRAIELLREAATDTSLPQLVQNAGRLLAVAETTRSLMASFGTPTLSLQMGAMMQSLTELQRLVREVETSGLGSGSHVRDASFFDTEWPSRADPTDYPSAVFVQTDPPRPRERRERPAARAPGPDVDALRKEIRTLMGAGDDTGVFGAAIDLLRAAEAPEQIDEFVAAATRIVHGADPASGTDRFLLAVALHLRGLRDDDGGDGWGEEPDAENGNGDTDAQAALAGLVDAAEAVCAQDPDGIPALVYLATLGPDGALAALGARLGGLSTLVRSVGAEAVYLPEPVEFLRWDAAAGRFDGARTPCPVEAVVVVDDGSGRATGPAAPHDDVTVISVASFSQLRTLSERTPRPIAQQPFFVANPRGDREAAAVETMLLRRSFYPQAVGYGALIEAADGPGTPEEVRAALNGSMVHLACGVTETGTLLLADAAELDLTDAVLAGAGVVVLPPDHFLPLADRLIAAGCSGVVGWRRPVPADVAAAAAFVLHAELADGGRSPAEAVRAVRRWLREPDTEALPPLLAARFDAAAATACGAATALVYLGR